MDPNIPIVDSPEEACAMLGVHPAAERWRANDGPPSFDWRWIAFGVPTGDRFVGLRLCTALGPAAYVLTGESLSRLLADGLAEAARIDVEPPRPSGLIVARATP